MRILILGIDGYIGWPLALNLLKKGHEVSGIDNYSRRDRVIEIGSDSLTPIASYEKRKYILEQYKNFKKLSGLALDDSMAYSVLKNILQEAQFDTIIHLAEQPSAPWSMIDSEKAVITQRENVLGTLNLLWAIKETCPETHLIKLGSMGEYGTPKSHIPEGSIPKQCLAMTTEKQNGKFDCIMEGMLFPRQPGSFYHLSKVHDTYNIEFACRNWGLSSTDIMQGVVFGLNEVEYEAELTRFDYDEYFGTAINRFCAQAAINNPLTIYGRGFQTRGFLPLKDSIQCLTIAIENPPRLGVYRTFNQYESTYSINTLAYLVSRISYQLTGIKPQTSHLKNPRNEKEEHPYSTSNLNLISLGYKPSTNLEEEITKTLEVILKYKHRVIKDVILPKTNWR